MTELPLYLRNEDAKDRRESLGNENESLSYENLSRGAVGFDDECTEDLNKNKHFILQCRSIVIYKSFSTYRGTSLRHATRCTLRPGQMLAVAISEASSELRKSCSFCLSSYILTNFSKFSTLSYPRNLKTCHRTIWAIVQNL